MGEYDSFQFVDTNARKIAERLHEVYESIRRANGESNYKIADGDPYRLMQLTEAATLSQVLVAIDRTGKRNLLYFADDTTIDLLGYLYGDRGKRLDPTYAQTTIRYTLANPRNVTTVIPAGFRTTPDNKVYFATVQSLDIPAGSLYADVVAQAMTPGASGQGFKVGTIKNMVDLLPFVKSAANITESTGGSDREDLESYRDRLRRIPESFTVAGSEGAYDFWTRTADPAITDVNVWMPPLDLVYFKQFLKEVLATFGVNTTPSDTQARTLLQSFHTAINDSGTGPGNVNISVLLRNGSLPSQEINNKIGAILSGRTIRPVTDWVHVKMPQQINYSITIRYWVYKETELNSVAIGVAINEAVDRFTAWQNSKQGEDINPSLLYEVVMGAGPKRIEILSPVFTRVEPGQVARLTGKTITLMGVE